MLKEMQDLDDEIKELSTMLSEVFRLYPVQVRAAMQARLAHEIAEAKAIDQVRTEVEESGIKMNVSEREALVTLRTYDERKDHYEADVDVDITKKKLANIDSRLSAVQSRASLAKAEVREARIG